MKKSTKYLLLMVIFLGLLSLIPFGYSYAKYASNSVWNYYLEAKGFYLSSEELGSEQVVNVNNNWNFEKVPFTLRNSTNEYLVSDFDITYTVTCSIQNDISEYSRCTLNGTDSDTFTGKISSSSICVNNKDNVDVSSFTKKQCDDGGYEWKVEKHRSELYFEIIKTSEETEDGEEVNLDYVSVLIEVTSTSPYSKTLLGEFNLSSTGIYESGLKVNYKEFDNYSRVIVSNSYDENKCVKLSFNSDDLIIDDTNIQISSYIYDENNENNINGIIFNIKKRENISYLFYRTDYSKSFDYKDFILVESDECTT